MKLSIRITALAAALIAVFPALAETASTKTLPPVVVSATGIPYNDAEATYASEVHTRETIEASGATTLYDYLAQHTSLNVTPSYGNKATPMVDMRGYGANGYQNIAFTVDGRRLNNIDMVGPLIGAIPLSSIESIEISKGSGSVIYGDGAMAGAVQIHTKPKTGASVSAMVGTHGATATSVAAGLSKELFDFSFNSDNTSFAGTSTADPTGNRDHSGSRTEQARLTLKPTNGIKLFAEGTDSHNDQRYANSLTLAQYNANPGQFTQYYGSDYYNQQILDSRAWKIGGEFSLNAETTLNYTHGGEDRDSIFTTWRAAYDTSSDDISLRYRGKQFDLTSGVQVVDGQRIGSNNVTSKKNTGAYVQGAYRLGLATFSAGVRNERVEYSYHANSGSQKNAEHDLNAWDLGTNYRFSEQLSVFANLNQAFQAPDIDRFFTGGNFNAFIQPAKVHTATVGFNHDTASNRFRLAAFHSKLANEIYYFKQTGFTSANTNIDKSHKDGIELQDYFKVSENLSLNASYTYTRAIIDSEDKGAGLYNGKELPGVPRHGLVLGVTWQPWAGGTFNASHVLRSKAYAAEDFTNSMSQRQASYQITNLSLRQRWGNIEGSVSIDNLFAHKNGIWIKDNNIYPVDFERIVKVGVKLDF